MTDLCLHSHVCEKVRGNKQRNEKKSGTENPRRNQTEIRKTKLIRNGIKRVPTNIYFKYAEYSRGNKGTEVG